MNQNKEIRSDVWNPMVKLINETKDPKIKDHAEMLLRQYNSSGGLMIKGELENFLTKHGY